MSEQVTGGTHALPTGGVAVPNSDPEHDEKVKDLIWQAQKHAMLRESLSGVAVMDFSDATVVVLSKRIPSKEVFVVDLTHLASTEVVLRKQR